MRAIRKVDTRPELIVRRLASRLGYRYRLHGRKLPGTPDLVFAGRKKVILVHGCFWHRHDCAAGRKSPGRNLDYWGPKLARNQERDQETQARLGALGWDVLTVWECEVDDEAALVTALTRFLGPPRRRSRSAQPAPPSDQAPIPMPQGR